MTQERHSVECLFLLCKMVGLYRYQAAVYGNIDQNIGQHNPQRQNAKSGPDHQLVGSERGGEGVGNIADVIGNIAYCIANRIQERQVNERRYVNLPYAPPITATGYDREITDIFDSINHNIDRVA